MPQPAPLSAFMVGCEGAALTAEERGFLAEHRPCGLILFDRNCRSADQIRALATEFRAAVGHDGAIVAVDQEGGRVQRIKPPIARALPKASALADAHAQDPAQALADATVLWRLVAAELAALGISMNCVPVLDLPAPGADPIIGDRAFGIVPEPVIALGRAVVDAHVAMGLAPVIKHLPGHGRANADSHLALPVIDADRASLDAHDFVPFRALNSAPAAMTAHVVLSCVDDKAPATCSAAVVDGIIRGALGFDGLLLSDDLSMGALSGSLTDRAVAALGAGCDVALHCNGRLDEMRAVAAGSRPLAGAALARFDRLAALWRGANTTGPDAATLAAGEAAIARFFAFAA